MADPILLSWTILDEGGKKKSLVYPVVSTATLAQLQAFVDVHADKLDNAIGGVIQSAQVTIPLSLALMAFPKAVPVADHNVYNGGLLSFDVTGTKYKFSMYVPTYLRTLINPTDGIDYAGASQALIDSILGGEAVITVQDMAGRNLAAFLGGERRDRR